MERTERKDYWFTGSMTKYLAPVDAFDVRARNADSVATFLQMLSYGGGACPQ
jgi:hypothetical protein